MNRITADRETFIHLFTERLLVEYLNYEIFRARIINLGLIPEEEDNHFYWSSLSRNLWRLHSGYTYGSSIKSKFNPSVYASICYDLFCEENLNYSYDKHLTKILPGDLIATGSLKVSIYLRRSKNNRDTCVIKNVLSGATQYVSRDNIIKIYSESISELLRPTQ